MGRTYKRKGEKPAKKAKGAGSDLKSFQRVSRLLLTAFKAHEVGTFKAVKVAVSRDGMRVLLPNKTILVRSSTFSPLDFTDLMEPSENQNIRYWIAELLNFKLVTWAEVDGFWRILSEKHRMARIAALKEEAEDLNMTLVDSSSTRE